MKEFGIGIIEYGFMGKAHTYAYRTMPPFIMRICPFVFDWWGLVIELWRKPKAPRRIWALNLLQMIREMNCLQQTISILSMFRTPNNLHKDHVIGALKAGKHVYCDKPLTATYEESREILSVLEALLRPLPKWHFSK